MSDSLHEAKDAAARPPAEPAAAVSAPEGERRARPDIPDVLPILPLRGTVVFPGSIVPLTVHRESSLKLLDESLPASKIIGVVAERDPGKEAAAAGDVFEVGAALMVLKLIRQPDEGVLIVGQALQRFRVRRFVSTEPYFKAEIELLESRGAPADSKHWEAEVRNLKENALKILATMPEVPEQARMLVMNIDDAGQLADFLASNLQIDAAQKQVLLEELDVERRVRAVQTHIAGQLEIAEIQQRLQKDVASQFSDAQRKAYLREQLKAIQRELGEGDAGVSDQTQRLRDRMEKAHPPADVMAEAERELKRLEVIPPASPEYSVIVGYVETIADLPWQTLSEDDLDLDKAQSVLDRDHYGLHKVKRRLIEYLAVRKLNPEGRGPILCFLGPPGVGKTSLGQSIADALGRKFSRISLGGIRDEAEIRGHRRTYIGSMPGRIIQELRRLGSRNPVLMLDEIDKLGADFRGDPASALLEVLDPRQNHAFVDRYLDLPFDLSKILFIGTANAMDTVPAALRDRLEVIEIPGYTESEKLEIARKYLLPRQLTENGLKSDQCPWDDEALKLIIASYTREAGVRELERQIGAVCRGVAARVARGKADSLRVTTAVVAEFLGPPRYVRETRLAAELPGVVTGLAYTPMGGEVLHIEATRYPGTGKITLTGQIGEVMKESVQAAFSLVRSRAGDLGIDPAEFRDTDLHVHVPAGAVPKDGPSAGVAMFTAIASLFCNRRVRADTGMTGEITLRGLVLPIGGLKEKCLAALRAGLKTVLIPKLNEKDLGDVPDEARHEMEFVLVENVDAVLENALVKEAPPSGS